MANFSGSVLPFLRLTARKIPDFSELVPFAAAASARVQAASVRCHSFTRYTTSPLSLFSAALVASCMSNSSYSSPLARCRATRQTSVCGQLPIVLVCFTSLPLRLFDVVPLRVHPTMMGDITRLRDLQVNPPCLPVTLDCRCSLGVPTQEGTRPGWVSGRFREIAEGQELDRVPCFSPGNYDVHFRVRWIAPRVIRAAAPVSLTGAIGVMIVHPARRRRIR